MSSSVLEMNNQGDDRWSEIFRRASSHIPSGVGIVAGIHPREGIFAFTVSSITSVSVKPSLVSVCIASDSARITQLKEIRRFSINLLRHDQPDLARRFGNAQTNRFAGLRWYASDFGAPVLEGMAVVLVCELKNDFEAGDHQILISEVLRLVINGGEPLVYWRRGLHGLKPEYPFVKDQQVLDQFVRDWESGVLPQCFWTHAAHVGIASYYAFLHPAEVAFQMTKTGIWHYNACVGTRNSEDSGYHETLTRFWSGVVGGFVRARRFGSQIEAVREAVKTFGEERDLHRLYYSFDVVRNRRARREWIPPDRVPPQGSVRMDLLTFA